MPKRPPVPRVTRRTVVSPVVARTLRIPATGAARERSVRFRIGLTWALLVLNVLTFYPHTWSGQSLILPIPSIIGKKTVVALAAFDDLDALGRGDFRLQR